MPGRFVDFGRSGIRLPDPIAVDTSLLVARFLTEYFPPHLRTAAHARRCFALLSMHGAVGLVMPVVFQELLHVAIRGFYRRAVAEHRSDLAVALPMKRRFDWDDLYKVRPDLLVRFLPEFDRLRESMNELGLAVPKDDELAPLPPGRTFDDELLAAVGRYRLDTGDAMLLLEARRAGVTAVATRDSDLRRAQLDFDVYTWL